MDLCLHNHPIIPPAVPLAGAESGDVHSQTLGPVLEVVAAKGGRYFPGRAQYVEEPEQAHRRPHAHVHLTEVNEDHHQRDVVRRQVVELKVVGLQQREEEGGEREYEPIQGVEGEEDELTVSQVTERDGSTPHPHIEL
jgi:hypothetical protein